MPLRPELVEQIQSSVETDRLLETAVKLIEIPSPTRDATAVADRLEQILTSDGFDVERPVAGWPKAPAVAVRLETGIEGPTLQFNGHLDTVHLPFVPPRVKDGLLYGSGASDMKGGIAAMVEALRVLRDTKALPNGSVLLTAHDLHELPWGDGSQIDRLIEAGYLGDAVLLPEYCSDRLPVIGRGLAVLEVTVSREGEPVHEVLGGSEQPSVLLAGAEVLRRFGELDRELAGLTDPLAGRESLFIGKAGGGEIFNQAPTEFELSGTRRWLPGNNRQTVERQYHDLLAEVAALTGTTIDGRFLLARDAFQLDQTHPFVAAFQSVSEAVMGKPLPIDAKPFVDDGNAFAAAGGIPAITHGPDAKGAHTLNEEVPIAELVRVAAVYALSAIAFSGTQPA